MTYDLTKLPDWITRTREAIEGDRLAVADRRGELIFRDHGSDVLLVAHVDSVDEDARTRRPKIQSASRISHVALDDRLGCWAIEAMYAEGVACDLLFTDCEESGWSTGDEFIPPRPYKFILSFDRMGVDSVLYQYGSDPAWRAFVARHLGPIGQGSYSCVAAMEALGVCGVNVGIGYYDHNTSRCWADLNLTIAQMNRARCFIARARRRAWPYAEPIRAPIADRRSPIDAPFMARDARASEYVLADYREQITRRAARLCIACAYAGEDAHHCPYVADCLCCEATSYEESRYDFHLR